MKQALSRKNLWERLPVPLKRCVGAALGALPLPWLLGKDFRSTFRFLEDAQRWPPERYREYQVTQLRRICRIAAGTPFYRRRFAEAGFAPDDLKQPEDLRALPTIDKATLRSHLADMCARDTGSADVDYTSTGGTSGQPLEFYINAGRSAREYAYLLASWARAGFAPGTTVAVFRGRTVAEDRSGLRHQFDPLLRQHFYSNFHMTDENMRRYLEHVRTIGPCFLHVYPSSAATLAHFIRRSGVRPPANIRGIIAESEIVYPDQRSMVEEVFGRRLFSCYGHTEKLVLAAECEHSCDYHVWPTYGWFELLDEQGRPVTTPGRTGEIVGTGFINDVVPFIRYRTGDFATWVADCCGACGRNHPIVRDIRGHRIQEYLVASDGARISWTAVNMHDDTFACVRQFQFYQDTPGRATLRIVPAEGFGDEHRERIRRNLGAKFAGRLDFAVERVEAVRLTARGKGVYVDQRIEG